MVAECDAHVGLCLKKSYAETELCQYVHLLVVCNLIISMEEVNLATRGWYYKLRTLKRESAECKRIVR